jgi:hypothetical protein
MSTSIVRFEKIAREIIEKHENILRGDCDVCVHCAEHRKLLLRANFQTITLMRGLVLYLERMKQDRRERRRRYKQNVNMRKNFN